MVKRLLLIVIFLSLVFTGGGWAQWTDYMPIYEESPIVYKEYFELDDIGSATFHGDLTLSDAVASIEWQVMEEFTIVFQSNPECDFGLMFNAERIRQAPAQEMANFFNFINGIIQLDSIDGGSFSGYSSCLYQAWLEKLMPWYMENYKEDSK